tara:strand:+ start:229 stop:432 length:204 start_codon:yes stop_codon:yes gene_type:complete
MKDYDFGHWVHPSGVPFTKETMREVAIETFKRLLKENRNLDQLPQDGSRGQALAFEHAMLKSLEGGT